MSVDRTGQTLESPWTESTRAQWQRLREHAFEDAQAPLDFAAKLACEQGWSRDQALAAIEEYRRYCFLASVEAGMVVPSVAVDEVWHLHLTYSEDYWLRFCPAALGFAFHHRPGGLVRGDSAQYRRGYADTLAHYERWFGAPPERWWPGTAERFRAPARFRRVDTEQVWLVRKPVWPRRPTAITAGVAATVTALMASSFAEAASLNPLDWSGPKFLLLFMVLMIISLSFALDREVRERLDPHLALRHQVAQEGVAAQRGHAVDHDSAAAADGHAARPSEGQAAIEVVLDVLQALQHRHVVGEGHLVGLVMRLGVLLRVVALALDADASFGSHCNLSPQVISAFLPSPPYTRALGCERVMATGLWLMRGGSSPWVVASEWHRNLTCILVGSGSLIIVWRSRTIAPSSTTNSALPPRLLN